MSPPHRDQSRPLMLAAGTPSKAPRGLMSVETGAFAGFDLHLELTRVLWAGVGVLAAVLYLTHAAR